MIEFNFFGCVLRCPVPTALDSEGSRKDFPGKCAKDGCSSQEHKHSQGIIKTNRKRTDEEKSSREQGQNLFLLFFMFYPYKWKRYIYTYIESDDYRLHCILAPTLSLPLLPWYSLSHRSRSHDINEMTHTYIYMYIFTNACVSIHICVCTNKNQGIRGYQL